MLDPHEGQKGLKVFTSQLGQVFATSPARVPQLGQNPEVKIVLQLLQIYLKSAALHFEQLCALSSFCALQ